MPAIRRPRIDVILRVPKRLPYSAEGAIATASGSTSSAQASSSKGKQDVKLLDGASNATSIDGIGGLRGDRGRDSTPKVTVSGPDSGDDEPAAPVQPIAKASETSSAEWNSLLIWARRARGPQWDSGLGMWMVDRESSEYTTFCSDPAQSVFGTPSGLVDSDKHDGGEDGNEDSIRESNTGDGTQRSPAKAQAGGHRPSAASPRGLHQSPSQTNLPHLSSSHSGSRDPTSTSSSNSAGLPPPHFTPGGGGFHAAGVGGLPVGGGPSSASTSGKHPMAGSRNW